MKVMQLKKKSRFLPPQNSNDQFKVDCLIFLTGKKIDMPYTFDPIGYFC